MSCLWLLSCGFVLMHHMCISSATQRQCKHTVSNEVVHSTAPPCPGSSALALGSRRRRCRSRRSSRRARLPPARAVGAAALVVACPAPARPQGARLCRFLRLALALGSLPLPALLSLVPLLLLLLLLPINLQQPPQVALQRAQAGIGWVRRRQREGCRPAAGRGTACRGRPGGAECLPPLMLARSVASSTPSSEWRRRQKMKNESDTNLPLRCGAWAWVDGWRQRQGPRSQQHFAALAPVPLAARWGGRQAGGAAQRGTHQNLNSAGSCQSVPRKPEAMPSAAPRRACGRPSGRTTSSSLPGGVQK